MSDPVITGAPVDRNAPIPVRMELRDMRNNNPAMWNLYLLAMEKFQDTANGARKNETSPLSYFQIAGIHGEPTVQWPNHGQQPVDANAWGGYCTHSSSIFLTWHRPYLALFEQELCRHVRDIAAAYSSDPRNQKYRDAAKNFRMPYWDWARPDTGRGGVSMYPEETMTNTLHRVVRPGSGGKDEEIWPNPLAYYEFGSTGSAVSAISTRMQRFQSSVTLRNPVLTRDRNGRTVGVSDDAAIQGGAAQERGVQSNELPGGRNPPPKGKNLTERTFYILQSYSTYAAVSNNALPDPDRRIPAFNATPNAKIRFENWGGLEDTHNSIHGYVGGSGYMGNPAVAAFDPIFWLHHTNIDRLYAIWQALHEDGTSATFVEPSNSQKGTFTTKVNAVVTKDSDLTPFNHPQGGFWTSAKAQFTTTFGYTYPETQGSLSRNQILASLSTLYNQASVARMVSSARVESASIDDSMAVLSSRAEVHQQVAQASMSVDDSVPVASMSLEDSEEAAPQEAQTTQPAPIELPKDRSILDIVPDNKYLEWMVNIKAEKHSLDGNFLVHVFLGDVDESDPSRYVYTQNHVAAFYTFGSDTNTGCEKCQTDRASGLQVSGQIPLTIALVERYLAGQVDGLTVEAVTPFLQKNLHWRVTTVDGTILNRSQVADLLVAVVTCEVTLPEDPNALPIYSDTVEPHPSITTNIDETGGRGDGTGYNVVNAATAA